MAEGSKTVLITGGAGSLGKAFVKLLHKDYHVVVVDNSEWAISELQTEFPDLSTVLADFSTMPLAEDYDFVIHCAAYKHVGLGEENVAEFIDNNLTKTVEFYKRLDKIRVGQLLYISTDKAVEPISAYGMTKALAERLTWQIGGQVARSGNFIGSSGSVIPVWEKQIREGKPVSITDERMVRYVIDLDEGAKQIWAKFLENERLIVPEMREVRIMDLLADVLKRHAYMNPQAYEPGVTVIGIGAGEKLREKLKWDDEL